VKNTRRSISPETDGTYYSHLNCTRGSNLTWHIDWRNVCNGNVDCWDGADEAECWQMEQNVCEADEYRCFNGQCIPEVFFLDNVWDPDCMDGTDEPKSSSGMYPANCNHGDPSMRCEDTTCRHWSQILCGVDSGCAHSGSCRTQQLDAFILPLLTREANLHLNDECWATMLCVIQRPDLRVSLFYFSITRKENAKLAYDFSGYRKNFYSFISPKVLFFVSPFPICFYISYFCVKIFPTFKV
jgi:hypothetical protein